MAVSNEDCFIIRIVLHTCYRKIVIIVTTTTDAG